MKIVICKNCQKIIKCYRFNEKKGHKGLRLKNKCKKECPDQNNCPNGNQIIYEDFCKECQDNAFRLNNIVYYCKEKGVTRSFKKFTRWF